MVTPTRTTIGQTARRIQRQLSAGQRPEINVLANTIDATATTADLQYTPTPSVRAGAVMEIDRELMRIMSVSSSTVTLYREWADSEPDGHAAGSEVRVNPRFSIMEIVDTMIDELASWPPDLFRVLDYTVPVQAESWQDLQTFEIPVEFQSMVRILDVRRHSIGSSIDPYMVTTWPHVSTRLQRGSTSFGGAPTSGLLLRLIDQVWTGSLYVQFAMPFLVDEFELDTDLVDDVGMDASMLDVLSMGVRMRLIGEQETPSSGRDAQNASPGENGVQATAATKQQSQMYAMYLRRRSEEMNKLRLRYPWTF